MQVIFEPQYLRDTLIDNSDSALSEYVAVCYSSLFKTSSKKIVQEENWFVIKTITYISDLLKDKEQSPILKFKATKMIMYLLMMGEPYINQQFQNELFPFFKNSCFYNRSLKLQERGKDYFKNSKYYDVANKDQKGKLKALGVKFVIFCLETVYILAKWMPFVEENRKKPSEYAKAIHLLKKQENISFPEQKQFIFYNEARLHEIEKNVKSKQQQVYSNKFSLKSTGLMKYALNKQSDYDSQIYNIATIEQLEQQQQLIKEYKQNLSDINAQKQFLIEQFQKEKKQFEQKLSQYENQIQNLYYQLKYVKKKLKIYQKQTGPQISIENDLKKGMQSDSSYGFIDESSDRSDVMDLREKVKLLIEENQILRDKVEGLSKQNSNSSKTEKQNVQRGIPFTGQSRKQINQLNSDRRELMEQLLKNQLHENQEYASGYQGTREKYVSPKNKINLQGNTNKSANINRELGQKFHPVPQVKLKNKNSQKSSSLLLFQPFYSLLNSESKTRLKKSLLKSKEILYKDKLVEIGTKFELQDQITIKLDITLTNIMSFSRVANSSPKHGSASDFNNLRVDFVNKNNKKSEVNMRILNIESSYKNTRARKGEQWKQTFLSRQNIKSPSKKSLGSSRQLYLREQHLDQNSVQVDRLPADQQLRVTLAFQINSINFSKAILMRLSYYVGSNSNTLSYETAATKNTKQSPEQLGLILPISKLKLIQPLVKSTMTLQQEFRQRCIKNNQKKGLKSSLSLTFAPIIKLLCLNHKIVSSFGKLAQYFGGSSHVFLNENENGIYNGQTSSQSIRFRVQFLQKVFQIHIKQLNQQQTINNPTSFKKNKGNHHNFKNVTKSHNAIESINSNNQQFFDKKSEIQIMIYYEKSQAYILASSLLEQLSFILSQES